MDNVCGAIARCLCGAQQDDDTFPVVSGTTTDEKQPLLLISSPPHRRTQVRSSSGDDDDDDDRTATRIVAAILAARLDDTSGALEVDIAEADVVRAQGWTEDIAAAVLSKLARAIAGAQDGQSQLGGAAREAVDVARVFAAEIFGFAHERPEAVAILGTLAAVGVLYVLTPWVLGVLGFEELGPVAGTSFQYYTLSTYIFLYICCMPSVLCFFFLFFSSNISTGSFAARWQARYLGFVPEGSWFSFFQRLAMIWGKS